MLSICPKCSKPDEECTCDMFKGLESAYDKLDITDWKFIPYNEGDWDLGSHYRHSFMGYNMDVYRVLEIFKVTCPVAQHIIKKLLRGEGKGHTMDFVWNEVKQAVERKFEMMEEDK